MILYFVLLFSSYLYLIVYYFINVDPNEMKENKSISNRWNTWIIKLTTSLFSLGSRSYKFVKLDPKETINNFYFYILTVHHILHFSFY